MQLSKFCQNCNTENPGTATNCQRCGNPLPSGNTTIDFSKINQRWLVTAVLCLFLGWLGVHKFYTGRTTSGVIMLVLGITGIGSAISAIWALVDLITLILGTYTDINGQKITIN